MLLHGGALVAMAQACVGVVGVSVAGVLWCVQMSESCGEDFVQARVDKRGLSVLSVGQELRRHRRRGRWLSVSMWWPGLLGDVAILRMCEGVRLWAAAKPIVDYMAVYTVELGAQRCRQEVGRGRCGDQDR